jgi:hypothetical protein
MKQYIRKADIILLTVLIAIGLASTAVLALRGDGSGSNVVIKSGGEVFATYPLSEDRTIEVPAPGGISYDSPRPHAADEDDECTQYTYYNVVKISGGSVTVSSASCRNQVCVRHSSISKAGESIVCLPNRLVVSIEGSKGGSYDSVTS